MNADKVVKRDLYHTHDHEWIDFQGTVAYVGVCSFKLKGIKQIDQLVFTETDGFKHQGALVATIKYDDYLIPFYMPVAGKIIQINQDLLAKKRGILLSYAKSNGWIALIIPAKPYERKNLLLPNQYRINSKGKYAQ